MGRGAYGPDKAPLQSPMWTLPAQLLPHPLQLLQAPRRAHHGRQLLVGEAGRPIGDADFADIDVAPRIQREAVRRQELAGRNARTRFAAEPSEALALRVDDGEPRPE